MDETDVASLLVDRLSDLLEAVDHVDDAVRVRDTCQELLKREEDGQLSPELKRAVLETYLHALLDLKKATPLSGGEDDDEAKIVSALIELRKMQQQDEKKNDDDDDDEQQQHLHLLSAYVQYKLDKHRQVVKALQQHSQQPSASGEDKGDDDLQLLRFSRQVLEAQAMFHSGLLDESANLYQQILMHMDDDDDDDDEEKETTTAKVQLWTNLLSVYIAMSVPYCSGDYAHASTKNSSVSSNSRSRSPIQDQIVMEIKEYLRLAKEDLQRPEQHLSYELAYNLATWQLLQNRDASQLELLKKSKQELSMRYNEEEQQKAPEWMPLKINSTLFSRLFWEDCAAPFSPTLLNLFSAFDGTTTTATAAVQTIQAVNRALILLDSNDSSSSSSKKNNILLQYEHPPPNCKFNVLQQRLWYYNRAILQYRQNNGGGDMEGCRDTCHYLLRQLGINKGPSAQQHKQRGSGKNKAYHDSSSSSSRPNLAVQRPEDKAWWSSRIHVLLAYCDSGHDDASVTAALLEANIDECRNLHPSPVRDQALAYGILHRARLQQQQEASSDDKVDDGSSPTLLLSHLQEELPPKPAIQMTQAAILLSSREGEKDESKAKIDALLPTNKSELADFYMSQGMYEQAAALYQEECSSSSNNNDNAMAKARWIRAMTYGKNPEEALRVWSELRTSHVSLTDNDDDDETVNGAQLEAMELPRFLGTTITMARTTESGGDTNTKKKKSRAKIMKQRAKKRQAYLSSLEHKTGTTLATSSKPDPERWLPKYERSGNRQRRKQRQQQQHRGAQGGVSDKEAAKLDVVARRQQQQQAAESGGDGGGRSTAHLSVSGGQRKGGGKRR